MTALALLLVAHLVGAFPQQGSPQQGPDAPASQNPILEGIAVQAGDELVFLSEYERYLKRALAEQPPRNRQEEEVRRAQLMRDLTVVRLEEQSGADLGIDKEIVERIRRSTLENQREQKGLEAYLAGLREKGSDALTEESDSEHEIYRELWEAKTKGLEAFVDKRQTRDGGVRPGELRDFYAENRRNLAPETVQLRWLIVSSAAVGGAEAARASCEDARQRVLAGEDFALLVEERGAELRDTRGLTPFHPPRAFPDPAIVPFCESAAVDELSPVLPLTNPKTGKPDPELGYQLAELHERNVPTIPEFSEPEVQRVLKQVLLRRRTDLVLGRARERLARDAFVWVNPLIGGPGPAPEEADSP